MKGKLIQIVFLTGVIFSSLSCEDRAAVGEPKSNQMNQQGEHAVIVYLKLSGDAFGTPSEGEAIYELEDKLEEEIEQHSVGEYDGHGFGEGYAEIFMYGPDADKLYDAIIETIKAL